MTIDNGVCLRLTTPSTFLATLDTAAFLHIKSRMYKNICRLSSGRLLLRMHTVLCRVLGVRASRVSSAVVCATTPGGVLAGHPADWTRGFVYMWWENGIRLKAKIVWLTDSKRTTADGSFNKNVVFAYNRQSNPARHGNRVTTSRR